MEQMNLAALRADYDRQAGRSLAMPIAGAIYWAAVAVAGWLLPLRPAILFTLIGSGAIMPLGALIARWRGERLFGNTNPFARLMGLSTLMVNLLWPVHIVLIVHDAVDVFPLSLGIAVGLHWIVFSWILDHPVGTIHACLRTALATLFWLLFPANRITAVAVAVVIAYLYSIVILATRTLNTVPAGEALEIEPEIEPGR